MCCLLASTHLASYPSYAQLRCGGGRRRQDARTGGRSAIQRAQPASPATRPGTRAGRPARGRQPASQAQAGAHERPSGGRGGGRRSHPSKRSQPAGASKQARSHFCPGIPCLKQASKRGRQSGQGGVAERGRQGGGRQGAAPSRARQVKTARCGRSGRTGRAAQAATGGCVCLGRTHAAHWLQWRHALLFACGA